MQNKLNLTQKLNNNILTKGNKSENWWKGACIYQVYPRSFADTNASGIGDIKGVTLKLPYLSDLGIDAIWLSPFFTSPMKDFGYDVSDYRNVDPIFGTLDDFKEMLQTAHSLGIRIMIDQVLSHTSNQHAWFKESSKDRTNDKKDWYVWADPKEDGTAPNNWLSLFGGPAWQWDAKRMQYYMHNFLIEQPDLNFHCKEVQEALLGEIEFWLKLGVDGFRLDTVNFFVHDKQLRNNPKASGQVTNEAPKENPYTMQNHLYDKTQIENLEFLKKFRLLLNKYPGSTSVGEIGAEHRSLEVMSDYTSDNDKMHMCYTFNFLGDNFSAEYFEKCINKFEDVVKDGWACWSFSNHDVPRHISRWCKDESLQKELENLSINLLLSLKGTACIYQGEELGFAQSEIKIEDLVDPYGITFWPEYKGRDGSRTPIAWENNEFQAGFSRAEKTWLPLDAKHIIKAANTQVNNESSTFNVYKNILKFRKNHEALKSGSINIIDSRNSLLKIRRTSNCEEIICIFNFSINTKACDCFEGYEMISSVSNNTTINNNKIEFKAYSYCFLTKK